MNDCRCFAGRTAGEPLGAAVRRISDEVSDKVAAKFSTKVPTKVGMTARGRGRRGRRPYPGFGFAPAAAGAFEGGVGAIDEQGEFRCLCLVVFLSCSTKPGGV